MNPNLPTKKFRRLSNKELTQIRNLESEIITFMCLQIVGFLLFVLSLLTSLVAEAATTQEFSTKGIHLLEAIRVALARDLDLRLQKEQVESSKGRLQTASGQFDVRLQSSVSHSRDNTPLLESTSLEETKIITDVTTYRFSVSNQLRSGAVISPGIEVSRTKDNFSNETAPARAGATFSIQLPLLRGRGKEVVAANETAARRDLESSILDLHQATAQSILNTTLAYWNYVAAKKDLDILRESESRANILVKETQTLIEADEIPAADLTQLLANLAIKTASRIQAEQRLFEARQNLGIEMGLPFQDISALPLPSDEFPKINKEVLPESTAIQFFIDQALNRRADLLALKQRQKSLEVLTVAARNGLKPQLDLSVDIGYAGLEEGGGLGDFFRSFARNTAGLNVSATLGYDWPVQNNSAQGLLVQQEAVLQQLTIQIHDLARRISSGVAVAIADLRNSSAELQKSQEAIRLFQITVDNEKQKLRLGTSTLIDVISFEDRLTDALRQNISEYLRYANALVHLRFETGTLLTIEQQEHLIGMEELITVPFSQSNQKELDY